ncbi:MAG: ATP synthase subunit I [Proteobacteria bacterium]|nr:ATP synthase subunit I [Pseudomonadota bacterium]
MKTADLPHQFAYRLIALQAGVVLIVAAGWLLAGVPSAVSALLGGLAAILPCLYFAHRFFSATHARQVNRIIRTFYWGELTKLLLSACLVIAVTKVWPKVEMIPFMSDYAAAYFSFWLAPLID